MMKRLMVFGIVFGLLLEGCATTKGVNTTSLTGSTWRYQDDQWTYDIQFLPDGRLKTTHPNDKTPDNDYWEQNNSTVKFNFNNGFSEYTGSLSSHDEMLGTARNKKDRTWTWYATLVDEEKSVLSSFSYTTQVNKNKPSKLIPSPLTPILTSPVFSESSYKKETQKPIPKANITGIKPLPPAPVADRDLPDNFKFPRNCQLPNEEKLPNDTRPRLFIMAVGISDYSQLRKGEQLVAPPHDAETIVKLFKKMEGKLFSKVHTCLLTSHSDLKPTADNLRDSLRFIRMAGQYDTAILFMAGHAVRDEGDKYYFLGTDAKFDSKGSVMPSTVLPWTDIIDNLKQPATTLAFIDTCHSGSLINKKIRSIDYNFASKLLTQGGTAVLTASNNDESALEKEGFGFFTRAIIDGLEKRKADSNSDDTITLDELDRYVSQAVSSYSDGQQHPVSSYPIGFDRNIPLWK